MDGSEPPQTSSLSPLVRKLGYWQKLDARDREAILALPHTLKALEQHHYIVRERDVATHSCLLLSGFAVRHKIVGGGYRQICAIQMPGDMVDLQNSVLRLANHSVQMLTRGQVAVIAREDIVRLAFEHPAVGYAMWFDTLVDGSIFSEWIANVGRRDARTRVSHLLCEFALRLKLAGLGDELGYQLPMTQEQLGDATGLTSVHVNRTLKQLQAEGLIDRVSPRSISIGDWKRLSDVGDFDSNYLHLHAKEPALA